VGIFAELADNGLRSCIVVVGFIKLKNPSALPTFETEQISQGSVTYHRKKTSEKAFLKDNAIK
jgi:hypothetical protein